MTKLVKSDSVHGGILKKDVISCELHKLFRVGGVNEIEFEFELSETMQEGYEQAYYYGGFVLFEGRSVCLEVFIIACKDECYNSSLKRTLIKRLLKGESIFVKTTSNYKRNDD